MSYKLSQDGTHLSTDESTFIPITKANRHFELALAELKAANLVTEAEEGTFTFSPDEVLLLSADVIPLATLRSQACDKVDQAAGAARSRYLTVAPGQEATYIAKELSARAYKAAGYPSDTTAYPWIAAESVATGATPTVAADNIIATADAWAAIGAQIEEIRISGKALINTKMNQNTINTALATILAQLDAI